MVGGKKEPGLSEVIGFLMIVALLGTLFSMYLVYVVPIQGKDAEISHMKYITQQFIDVKSDIDSLIINERVNMPIARSFELGTLSSSGQGALSIIPIQSFIEAAGTLVVNEQMDYLEVWGGFKTYNETPITSNYVSFLNSTFSEWAQVYNDREHLYVYYPGIASPTNSTITGNITYSSVNGTFRIFPLTRFFIDNTTPTDVWYIMANDTNNTTQNSFSIRSRTDVMLEIYNYTPSGQFLQYQKTLLENASYGGHLFDLYDGNEITLNNSSFLTFMHPTEKIVWDSNESTWEWIEQDIHRLGSLQYWSQNRYWINQELLYEMGGLFLKQNEGVSIMLIPSLAITPVTPEEGEVVMDFRVSLADIAVTDTNDVSGTKSAQIFAKVDSVVHDQLEYQGTIKTLVPQQKNARFLVIRFKPDTHIDQNVRISTTKLWKRAFDQIKVVTMKTMSEKNMTSYLMPSFDDVMKTYYIADPSASEEEETLSANLLIANYDDGGYQGLSSLMDSSYTSAADFLADVDTVTQKTFTEPEKFQTFSFEYTKAKISLVMQSGAL